MNKFGTLFGAAILALASLPVNAALMDYEVYTDRKLWGDAVSGLFQTEEFDMAIGNDTPIEFDKGIVSAARSSANLLNAVGPLPFPNDDRFKLSAYYGRVSNLPANEITWTFPDPVMGFFGDIGGLDAAASQILNVLVGDETESFTISSNGGWGILAKSSVDLFSDISWSSNVSQSFTIDNFSYTGATDPVSPVPVPPALWLFGTGLLALIGFSRGSKAV